MSVKINQANPNKPIVLGMLVKPVGTFEIGLVVSLPNENGAFKAVSLTNLASPLVATSHVLREWHISSTVPWDGEVTIKN